MTSPRKAKRAPAVEERDVETITKAVVERLRPVPSPTPASEWRRHRARQRDELDAFVEDLDPTRMPEERSLGALLAMAAGDAGGPDLAYSVIHEVRTILDAKAGEECEDAIAMMCVRKLDVALELLTRQRARPTAELAEGRNVA